MEIDNSSHFPNLKIAIENYCDRNGTKKIDFLLEELNNRFQEFCELKTFLPCFT